LAAGVAHHLNAGLVRVADDNFTVEPHEQRPAQEQVAHELSGSGRRVKVKSFGSARITADKVGRIVAIPVTGDEVALKDGILSEEHITVEGGRAVTEDTPASLVGR